MKEELVGYSAFSGSDIGYLILKDMGIVIKEYYSSEIDDDAISISKKHFPKIKHIGDITKVDTSKLKHINYMSAGSPCQGFSRNGKGLNFDDHRSKLFFVWNKQRMEINPKFFFLENVCMKKEWEDYITETLGVEPIKTNAGDYSAQKRPRTFWTNIPQVTHEIIEQKLLDIIEHDAIPIQKVSDAEKEKFLILHNGKCIVRNATKEGFLIAEHGDGINLSFPNSTTRRGNVSKQKCNTLDTSCNNGIFLHDGKKGIVRKYSLVELERLQGYPDNFTNGISLTARKKIIGNGWNKPQVSALHLGLKDYFLCH